MTWTWIFGTVAFALICASLSLWITLNRRKQNH
jgi:hypothetical protein